MGAPEQITTPIFRSVDQALHVAFLMEILPVRERGQMGRIIARMMVEAGVTAGRSEAGSVNFGGLSPLEVRGQCAMIRAAVRDLLPAHETAAIHAWFSYQCDKAAGVRGVVSYAGALLSVGHADARLAMGWAVFGTDAQRKGFTAAAIAREWAIPAKTVERDVATIKRTARRLKEAAVDALADVFRRDGVC